MATLLQSDTLDGHNWLDEKVSQAQHTLLSSDPTFSIGRSNTSTATCSTERMVDGASYGPSLRSHAGPHESSKWQ